MRKKVTLVPRAHAGVSCFTHYYVLSSANKNIFRKPIQQRRKHLLKRFWRPVFSFYAIHRLYEQWYLYHLRTIWEYFRGSTTSPSPPLDQKQRAVPVRSQPIFSPTSVPQPLPCQYGVSSREMSRMVIARPNYWLLTRGESCWPWLPSSIRSHQ
jgi:hypothetical protein